VRPRSQLVRLVANAYTATSVKNPRCRRCPALPCTSGAQCHSYTMLCYAVLRDLYVSRSASVGGCLVQSCLAYAACFGADWWWLSTLLHAHLGALQLPVILGVTAARTAMNEALGSGQSWLESQQHEHEFWPSTKSTTIGCVRTCERSSCLSFSAALVAALPSLIICTRSPSAGSSHSSRFWRYSSSRACCRTQLGRDNTCVHRV
jgi:hypothetical protein